MCVENLPINGREDVHLRLRMPSRLGLLPELWLRQPTEILSPPFRPVQLRDVPPVEEVRRRLQNWC